MHKIMDPEVSMANGRPARDARRGRAPGAAWRLGQLCLTVLCVALGAPAQNATNSEAMSETVAMLTGKLEEARAELSRVLAAQASTNNPTRGATALEATEYRLTAESVVRVCQQQIEELEQLGDARQRLKDFEPTAKQWQGFTQPPPYSILMVDSLRDSVQSLSAKVATSEALHDLLTRYSVDTQARVRESDGRLRLLAEDLETSEDPEKTDRLNWERTQETMANRLASTTAALNDIRRRKAEAELADSRMRLALARRKLALASTRTRFAQSELDQVLANLDAERQRLQTELQSAEADHERRQHALAAARADAQKALSKPEGTTADSNNQASRIRHLEDVVQFRTAESETSSVRQAALRELVDLITQERALWQLRFGSFNTHDLAKLQESYQQLAGLLKLVQGAKPFFLHHVDLAANLITEQSNRIQNRPMLPADLEQAKDLLGLYHQREEVAYRALRGLEKLERLCLWWKQSLDESRRELPLGGRIRDLFTEFSSFAVKLWQFELFVAEDTITVDGQPITGRRSVTAGKIVMAILILAVGYWLSILLASWLERIAVRRLHVEPNQANLIRRWARVAIIIALAIFSLASVKIPLTVFAFLGGALAIGLGFGTQNLLKNFISGILILFERPFRVGDLVDVGGNRGTVTSIGIRSSVLQLWDGTETLIPNSTLLENNLTNWTYSNHTVRFTLTVGVAYGSDTRRVAQVLADVADRHGLVLKAPAPQVLFVDFGASALNFELRYWVDVVKSNAAQVGSDLRHMIAGACTENSIVMAFPQQDVHLDSSRPLRIELAPPSV